MTLGCSKTSFAVDLIWDQREGVGNRGEAVSAGKKSFSHFFSKVFSEERAQQEVELGRQVRSLVSRSASSMCRTQNLVVLGSPKNQTVWSTGTLKHTVKQGAETKIGYHRPNPEGLRKCQEKLVLQTLVVRYLERIVKKRADRPLGLMKSKMAVVVGLHVLGLLPLDDPHSHQKN